MSTSAAPPPLHERDGDGGGGGGDDFDAVLDGMLKRRFGDKRVKELARPESAASKRRRHQQQQADRTEDEQKLEKREMIRSWVARMQQTAQEPKRARPSLSLSSLAANTVVAACHRDAGTKLTQRYVHPQTYARSPIVPGHSIGSRTLRREAHELIWSASNRDAYHRHKIDNFAERLLARADDETKPADDRALMKRAAEQLLALRRGLASKASKIYLSKDDHVYHVEGRAIDKSVTGALEEVCGTFDADATITRMIGNHSRWRRNKLYSSCNFDEFGNQLEPGQIRTRIQREWDQKRDLGIQLHDYIDTRYSYTEPTPATAAIEARIANTAGVGGGDSISSNTSSTLVEAVADTAATTTTTTTTNAASFNVGGSVLNAYNSWEQIRLFNDWLIVASEYPVYDLDSNLAGTIDAIYLPNSAYPRQVVLVDWKRAEIQTTVGNMTYEHPLMRRYAKGNYWKYAMQLNVYREILEKNYGLHVIEMYLVSFPPTDARCEPIGVPRMLEAKTFLEALSDRATAS